ncbi:hypothetical protein ASE75_05965 [Sphingomonas sp. Leaf17]|nr:hypothetical protein ASE75_05965 [Sphingomonas sp. Leaf17]
MPVTVTSNTATSERVEGTVANGAADSGNPVKVGCYFNGGGTMPTYSTAARADIQCDDRGNVRAKITANTASPVDGGTLVALPMNATVGNNAPSVSGPLGVLPYYMSGSTSVYARGDTTGAYVVARGGGTITTGQISVGTSSTLILAGRAGIGGRQKVTLAVGAANPCYFGPVSVTIATGFPLQPVAGATITIDTAAAIYAVCSAATTISYLEQY